MGECTISGVLTILEKRLDVVAHENATVVTRNVGQRLSRVSPHFHKRRGNGNNEGSWHLPLSGSKWH